MGLRFRLAAGLLAVMPIAVAPAVLTAAPASAAPAGADVEFGVTGTRVVELAGKDFFVKLHNKGPATAENIVVKVDIGGLDQTKLGVQIPAGCGDPDGTIFMCSVGSLVAGEYDSFFSPFSVTSLGAGTMGPAGSFTVEVTSDTPDPDGSNNTRATVPVEIAGPGYDLVALPQDVWATADPGEAARTRVAPGHTAPLMVEFVNTGSEVAVDPVFKVTLPPFVTFPADEQYTGCAYNEQRTTATCALPGRKIPPGWTLTTVTEQYMTVRVAADAPGPVSLTGGVIDGGARSSEPMSAEEVPAGEVSPELRVAPATDAQKQHAADSGHGPDMDEADNAGLFAVHVAANPADLQVTGGTASGALGATVTVAVKARNNGPASSPDTTVTITAPTGTELVHLPTNCEFVTPGRVARCVGALAAGSGTSGEFQLRIASPTVASDGVATIEGPLDDPDPANNSTSIGITVVGGGGGGLPVTGVNVPVLAGIGVGVIVVGGALFLLTRRRRTELVVPSDDA